MPSIIHPGKSTTRKLVRSKEKGENKGILFLTSDEKKEK